MDPSRTAGPRVAIVNSLEKDVLNAIRRLRVLAPGDRVGVAVSGGADSVALLRILEKLGSELGITLLVVHFDHRLRGAESDADAQFVAELAQERGLEFVVDREDVAGIAAENKWNLEDAARRLRYGFFERVVTEGRATRIAVAHTADDQAETVLAHILRGTGLRGLAGIYPVVGHVLRPLLGERRDELREYLRTIGQTWREDSTNADTTRLRARIRERLMPLLEEEFSPQATTHLAELAALAREEETFWDALVDDRLQELVTARDSTFSISIRDLRSPLVPASNSKGRGSVQSEISSEAQRTLTERLIRRLYNEASGGRKELAAEHVRQVIHLAEGCESGRLVELPGRVVAERVFENLVFSRAATKRSLRESIETGLGTAGYEHTVNLPSGGSTTVAVPELKRRFCLKVIDWSTAERETNFEEAALDADRLRAPLVLRNWRPGDAYRPRGRRQVQKLKRMFLTRRVPKRDRNGWPVLESAGEVAWVRGMPPADEFCVREDTRSGVVIEEEGL